MRVVKENVYRLLFKCAEMSFELERHPELKKKVIIADIYIYRICAWFVEFCLALFNEMRINKTGDADDDDKRRPKWSLCALIASLSGDTLNLLKKKSNKLHHFTGLLVLTLECLTIYMSLLLLKYACIDLNNVNIGWITSKQKWQQIKLHREAASLDKSFVTSFSISLSHLYHIIRPWWLDNSLNVFYPVSLSQK